MALLNEPADLRLARPSAPTAASDAAFDEAFATVAVPERRCDTGHAARETLSEAAQLAEALREQLASLDTQRPHLARLLNGLSA